MSDLVQLTPEKAIRTTSGEVHRRLSLCRQYDILNYCIENNKELSKELEIRGLEYDSLRYSQLTPLLPIGGDYLSLKDLPSHKKKIPAISLFSGCGGLDIAFERAGYEHLASFEFNEVFCNTIRRNRPSWRVVGPPESAGDLSNREETLNLLRKIVGGHKQFDGVFHGGPPCQPFSIAANQRFAKGDRNFKRVGFAHEKHGTLLMDFVYYVSTIRPKVFVLENVPGLMTIDDGFQLRAALEELSLHGYTIAPPEILDVVNHSVPQHRQRLIVCGWRGKGYFSFPQPKSQQVPCYKALLNPITDASNHICREHRAESILRYMELRVGERDHLGRVDRLNPNHPSKTVIAGGTKGGGRSHLHPLIPRTLTARECARLQTFPDDYVFEGAPARQFTQVGNAVPPVFGYQIARTIASMLFE